MLAIGRSLRESLVRAPAPLFCARSQSFARLSCPKRFVKLSEQFLTDLTDALDDTEHPVFEDVNYADGVLTIEMSDERCYVLNKQAPNLQVWLSSPVSGPQRFELELDTGKWMQIRTDEELVGLLEREFNEQFVQPGQPEISIKLE